MRYAWYSVAAGQIVSWVGVPDMGVTSCKGFFVLYRPVRLIPLISWVNQLKLFGDWACFG